MKTLKLAPRLVPKPLWYQNLRKMLSKSDWMALRQLVLDEVHGACHCCGEIREKGMVCDEVWEYHEQASQNVAILVDLRINCPPCDSVVHYGNSQLRGYGQEAMEHFMIINDLSIGEAQKIMQYAVNEWQRRSQWEWAWGISAKMALKYPQFLHNLSTREVKHHERI
jgi:hypothetical protein